MIFKLRVKETLLLLSWYSLLICISVATTVTSQIANTLALMCAKHLCIHNNKKRRLWGSGREVQLLVQTTLLFQNIGWCAKTSSVLRQTVHTINFTCMCVHASLIQLYLNKPLLSTGHTLDKNIMCVCVARYYWCCEDLQLCTQSHYGDLSSLWGHKL